MARQNTGVGRGNGAGSQRSWFKNGMPSANPHGRPRRPKREPDASLRDAALSVLMEEIPVSIDGVSGKQPRVTAMMKLLLSEYAKADLREKLAILRYVGSVLPETNLPRADSARMDPESVAKLVERLAEEYTRDQEVERTFGSS